MTMDNRKNYKSLSMSIDIENRSNCEEKSEAKDGETIGGSEEMKGNCGGKGKEGRQKQRKLNRHVSLGTAFSMIKEEKEKELEPCSLARSYSSMSKDDYSYSMFRTSTHRQNSLLPGQIPNVHESHEVPDNCPQPASAYIPAGRYFDALKGPELDVLKMGEVGELSEIFQWKGEVPKGLPGWNVSEKEHLGEELSDVLLYLVRLADICDVDLGEAALRKMRKNELKYPVELCKGSSKKYTHYSNGVNGNGVDKV